MSPFENGKYQSLMGQCKQLAVPDGQTPPIHHLQLWESAILCPVLPDKKEIKRYWLIDKLALARTRAWVHGCSGQACPEPKSYPIPEEVSTVANHTGWLATTDYRAYVWTYAYLEKDGSLSSRFLTAPDHPERFGHWVKFLNVDSPDSDYWNYSTKPLDEERIVNKTTLFERAWAQAHTYTRWAHSSSYYGFTPHSGALLTADWKEYLPFSEHFLNMYFDQALLLLYLRVCAFDFSLYLARIGADFRDDLCKLHQSLLYRISLR